MCSKIDISNKNGNVLVKQTLTFMILKFKKRDFRFLYNFALPVTVYVLLVVAFGYYIFQNDVGSILFENPAFFEKWFWQYGLCAIISAGLFFLAVALDNAVFEISKGTKMSTTDVAPFVLLGVPLIVTAFFSWTFFPDDLEFHSINFILLIGTAVYGVIYSSIDRANNEIGGSIVTVVFSIVGYALFRLLHLPIFYLTLISVVGFICYLIIRVYKFGSQITYGRMVTGMLFVCLGFISIGFFVKTFNPKPIVYVKTTLRVQANMSMRYRVITVTIVPDEIKTPQGWTRASNIPPKEKRDTSAFDVAYAKIVGTMDFSFPKSMPDAEKVKMIPSKWQNRGKFKDDSVIKYELLTN